MFFCNVGFPSIYASFREFGYHCQLFRIPPNQNLIEFVCVCVCVCVCAIGGFLHMFFVYLPFFFAKTQRGVSFFSISVPFWNTQLRKKPVVKFVQNWATVLFLLKCVCNRLQVTMLLFDFVECLLWCKSRERNYELRICGSRRDKSWKWKWKLLCNLNTSSCIVFLCNLFVPSNNLKNYTRLDHLLTFIVLSPAKWYIC